jgi:hypothetical protein
MIDVNQVDNLFDIMFVQKGDFRISKRNFRVDSLNDGTVDVMVSAQADARGNIMHSFVHAGFNYKLQSQIDFETGDITWSVIALDGGAAVFGTAKAKFRMFGNGNGRQVVKSYPRQDIIDIDADIEDSFEVENLEEVI